MRHWLQYWQLRTWFHDNLCYLTINCDTGQRSQFLQCLANTLLLRSWPSTDAYLIIVTTATTGGGVPFSSRRTFSTENAKWTLFRRVYSENKTPSTPKKTPSTPNKKPWSTPNKIHGTPNKTPSMQSQSKEYAKKYKFARNW